MKTAPLPVEYGDAGGWDLNDTVKFIRREEERREERDGDDEAQLRS